MRVLFYARGTEQLGVEYIMSYLESKGHHVELIFDRGLDNNLYYKLDFLKFLNKWDKLIKFAVDWKPDVVAFSTLTNVFPYAIEFAKRLKRHVNVPFVFGGIHPTVLPEYVLKWEEIDYVIRGEGEYPLEELLTSMGNNGDIKGIQNLCYKQDGKVHINPCRPLIQDLDKLPFPKRDEFYREGVFQAQLNVVTTRGCPFKCTYCVNSFYQEKLYKEYSGMMPFVRRRSPANVIDEIKSCRSKYPIKQIMFFDEIFTVNKKWLYEFLESFKREFPDITFSFCYHPWFVDDDVARWLSEAGGKFAQGAIETANIELRKNVLKRREGHEEIFRSINILRKYNIQVSTSAIFGIPHETSENRWETVDLIEKSNPDMVNTYLLYPFAGTHIAEVALSEGFLSEENWEKVKYGVSSYHQDSLLQNIDLPNAATMAGLLPLYILGPKFLKPLFRQMMKMRIPRFSHFLYIATVPLLYSGWTKDWIQSLLRIFYFSLFGKKKDVSK